MLILEIRLEEKIPVTMRFALGGVAIILNEFPARLDADKLCPVVTLILLAVKKPKLCYLRRVLRANLVIV